MIFQSKDKYSNAMKHISQNKILFAMIMNAGK